MNKYWLIPAAIVLVLALGIGTAFAVKQLSGSGNEHVHEGTHYHAGFQIYIEDKLQDFSTFEYMELKPCTTDNLTDDDTVHLHNGVGDVVHVHHDGMTWANLAQYLVERSGMNLSEDQIQKTKITGYVNGEKVDDIMSYPIKAYDSVVVFIGDKNTDVEGKLKGAVTIDDIKTAEASKENCGV